MLTAGKDTGRACFLLPCNYPSQNYYKNQQNVVSLLMWWRWRCNWEWNFSCVPIFFLVKLRSLESVDRFLLSKIGWLSGSKHPEFSSSPYRSGRPSILPCISDHRPESIFTITHFSPVPPLERTIPIKADIIPRGSTCLHVENLWDRAMG